MATNYPGFLANGANYQLPPFLRSAQSSAVVGTDGQSGTHVVWSVSDKSLKITCYWVFLVFGPAQDLGLVNLDIHIEVAPKAGNQ